MGKEIGYQSCGWSAKCYWRSGALQQWFRVEAPPTGLQTCSECQDLVQAYRSRGSEQRLLLLGRSRKGRARVASGVKRGQFKRGQAGSSGVKQVQAGPNGGKGLGKGSGKGWEGLGKGGKGLGKVRKRGRAGSKRGEAGLSSVSQSVAVLNLSRILVGHRCTSGQLPGIPCPLLLLGATHSHHPGRLSLKFTSSDMSIITMTMTTTSARFQPRHRLPHPRAFTLNPQAVWCRVGDVSCQPGCLRTMPETIYITFWSNRR